MHDRSSILVGVLHALFLVNLLFQDGQLLINLVEDKGQSPGRIRQFVNIGSETIDLAFQFTIRG